MSDLGPLCALRADMETDQDRSSRAPRSIRRASLRFPRSAGAKGLGWVEPFSIGSRRAPGEEAPRILSKPKSAGRQGS
jgi:hypothetical protein